MKKILFLGGPEFQIPFIKKAKEKGYFVGIIDISPNAPALDFADKVYISSVKDKEKVLEIAQDFNPDGITVGMVDSAVLTCAYVTTKLGLPGLSEEVAQKATNKYDMIKAFEKNNVPHPWFIYVPKEDINKKLEIPSYPVIVKPVDMAGSRGISIAFSYDELIKALSYSANVSERGNIIVEEYLEGPEVSVEIVVKDSIPEVIQITDKTTTGAPHFAEIGHLQPSQLPSNILNEIANVACNAAKSIGLINSLVHAEIKVTKNGPKMIELGARGGGDGIAEQLLELSTGVSFPEIALQIAMGEPITIPRERKQNASCIRFIQTQEGILDSIKNVDESRLLKGIADIKILGITGNQYHNVVDNSGRLGYVIATSESAESAKDLCDKAISKIIVNYR